MYSCRVLDDESLAQVLAGCTAGCVAWISWQDAVQVGEGRKNASGLAGSGVREAAVAATAGGHEMRLAVMPLARAAFSTDMPVVVREPEGERG